MINVALFSHTSALAGGERMLYNMALLLKQGKTYNPIMFIPTGDSKQLKEVCIKEHIDYVEISRYPWYIWQQQTVELEEITEEIKQQLINMSIRLIVNNTATSIIPNIVGVELGIPVIGWIHGVLDGFLVPDKKHMNRRLLFDRIYIELSERIFCCSEWTWNYYRHYQDNKMKVLHNWTPEPKEVAELPKDNKEGMQFVCLNTYDYQKGIFVLLEAIKKVRKASRKPFKITFYGDGNRETLSKMKKYIKDNKLDGYIILKKRTDDINKVYNEAHCLIQPSFLESFGMTIIEAMAHSRAVIASKSGGPEEIVEENISGFLVEKNNIEALAEKILYIVEHPECIVEMGRKGRAIYEEKFSHHKALSMIYNEFEKCLNSYIPYSKKHYLVHDMLVELYGKKQEDEQSIQGEFNNQEKPIQSNILIFSKPIKKEKSYTIRYPINVFSQIALIFATEKNKPIGKIKVSIYKGKKQIRSCTLNMGDICFNNWTTFKFEPIINAYNQKYVVKITCEYEDENYFGVYEDQTNRGLIYRVCNKLHMKSGSSNVIYYDIR